MKSRAVRYVHAPGAARRPALLLLAFALLFGPAACTPSLHSTLRVSDVELRALSLHAAIVCCRQRPTCDLPPRPFSTDVCSMWPDGNWGDCCIEHDIAYWCGGPDEARERADEALRACVRGKTDTCLGTLTYLGVRSGGAAWMPFPWRWGYGWNWLEDPR